MKQVYPKVRPRRLGTRGNSRYCYSGLRRCIKLKPPKLPDLTDKPLVTKCYWKVCSKIKYIIFRAPRHLLLNQASQLLLGLSLKNGLKFNLTLNFLLYMLWLGFLWYIIQLVLALKLQINLLVPPNCSLNVFFYRFHFVYFNNGILLLQRKHKVKRA